MADDGVCKGARLFGGIGSAVKLADGGQAKPVSSRLSGHGVLQLFKKR
jgi:hypothetical protein